jgi:hypothetical protein
MLMQENQNEEPLREGDPCNLRAHNDSTFTPNYLSSLAHLIPQKGIQSLAVSPQPPGPLFEFISPDLVGSLLITVETTS